MTPPTVVHLVNKAALLILLAVVVLVLLVSDALDGLLRCAQPDADDEA